jgi:hypothetical protein
MFAEDFTVITPVVLLANFVESSQMSEVPAGADTATSCAPYVSPFLKVTVAAELPALEITNTVLWSLKSAGIV